ncbi:DUF2190 family protein [Methylocella sp.]|jgi:predicted RecA/RadA family phage recombinase|uniref:DUF2190 family protein n=1 Tax=Methylocella sp. TaxID=1978226 RepID=UPI003C1E96FF
MAKNFLQKAEVITVTAPSGGLLSGQGVLIGALFGVSQFAAAAGASAEIATEGAWTLPKAASPIAFAQGAPVYWDAGAGDVTSVAHLNYAIGVATAAAAATDATAAVRLDGVATFAGA